MKNLISRRSLIKHGLMAGAVAPALGLLANSVAFADNAMLDPADPAAKGLGYITKSAIADQTCANCAQYKGAAGSSKGACGIFPGKDVAAGGYCKAWAKKPA
jgi:hypothetical protein